MGSKKLSKSEKIKELRQLLQDKENAAQHQIKITDELRDENREMRILLIRIYYGTVKGLSLIKEKDTPLGLKLGKTLFYVKTRFLKIPHRN